MSVLAAPLSGYALPHFLAIELFVAMVVTFAWQWHKDRRR